MALGTGALQFALKIWWCFFIWSKQVLPQTVSVHFVGISMGQGSLPRGSHLAAAGWRVQDGHELLHALVSHKI